MCIITTTGAKTGLKRYNPLVCLADGDRVIIFASKAGAPDNPDWYYNLVKNPVITVERGAETYEANATQITGDERDRLYAEQVTRFASFGEYEKQTLAKTMSFECGWRIGPSSLGRIFGLASPNALASRTTTAIEAPESP